MVNLFAVPVFLILFRESLESSIIVSILLAFLKQTLGPDRDPAIYKKLVRQVWYGTGAAFLICMVVGCGLIGAFYGLGKDYWAKTENIWEGVFSLVASIIITLMGAAILRVSKLQDKWRVKIAKAFEAKNGVKTGTAKNRVKAWCEKYAMFILPFITVLREGLEAVIFTGGVSLGLPVTAFPIPVIVGLLCGILVGVVIYKSGNSTSLQIFLTISTCFLYLVAAGLFSRAVWLFEMDQWNKVVGGDAAETGAGPGSYDIRQSVWHVNCCSPVLNGGGGWGFFTALFGWQNSATYGTVISYNLYWLVVIVAFAAMAYQEKKGHWPLMKVKPASPERQNSNNSSDAESGLGPANPAAEKDVRVTTEIKSVKA